MFHIVWEFRTRPGAEAEFESVYGSAGVWSGLFGRDPGYRGTALWRDSSDRRRYLVTDTWDAESSYLRFKHAHAGEYEALDGRCESLTELERRLGCFETLE